MLFGEFLLCSQLNLALLDTERFEFIAVNILRKLFYIKRKIILCHLQKPCLLPQPL